MRIPQMTPEVFKQYLEENTECLSDSLARFAVLVTAARDDSVITQTEAYTLLNRLYLDPFSTLNRRVQR